MTTETTTPNRVRTPSRRYGWTLLALPVLVGAISLSVAHAHGPGGPGGGFMQHRMEHLLDAAKATDAQKQQIKAIFDAAKPQRQALHQQEVTLHQQMQAALTAATIDANAIESLRQQQLKLMDQRSALFTQNLVAAAKVLSADQRKAVATEIAAHRGHHRWGGSEGGQQAD